MPAGYDVELDPASSELPDGDGLADWFGGRVATEPPGVEPARR